MSLLPWRKEKFSNIENCKSTADALAQSGEDWDVYASTVRYQNQRGEEHVFSGKRVIAREDNDHPFSVVGRSYHPLNNKEAFSFFDTFIEEGTVSYETAGEIAEGRQVYLVTTYDGSWWLNGREVKLYIILSNDFSGRNSLKITAVPMFGGCFIPLKLGAKVWSIWHTSSLRQKLERTRIALEGAIDYMDSFVEKGERMSSVKIEDENAKAFFEELVQLPKNAGQRGRAIRQGQLNKLFEAYKSGPNAGNAFGLLSAVADCETNKSQKQEALMKKILQGNSPLVTKAQNILEKSLHI